MRKTMTKRLWEASAVCAVAAFTLGVTSWAGAAEPATDSDPPVPGLEIGSKAPDFVLSDQNGKQQTLSNLLKKGKVALVFHRSADW